jgi:hypothetical protein
LLLPTINLNEDIIKKSLFDAFVATIKFTEPEKESKFLTHLVNFGNDEQTIISSWEEDNFTLDINDDEDVAKQQFKGDLEIDPDYQKFKDNSTFKLYNAHNRPASIGISDDRNDIYGREHHRYGVPNAADNVNDKAINDKRLAKIIANKLLLTKAPTK